jgi:hypothetical protein
VQLEAVDRLGRGEAIGIAGGQPPPGFVVLASGAPVTPVELIEDPVAGSRILFVGDPRHVPPVLAGADPASIAETRATSEWVRQEMADFIDDVRRRVPV